MCGLVGILSTQCSEELQLSMNNMLELINHRGPDGRGIETYRIDENKNLAFGHQRLAIIDTTDAGLMPMSSVDNNFSIIFNGEIFNYLELKDELTLLGYSFSTSTDTEVLLNSYIEWGSDCLNKLNGMFAFAIFNKLNNKLFIARDRFGVKPLYYFLQQDCLIFGSEIKSLLAHPKVKSHPNEEALGNFLSSGLINHDSETLFQDIFSLNPGHFIELNGPKISINKWYESPPFLNSINDPEKFKTLFFDAVKIRLRSDVEVGACLSGGTDSSAIVGAVSNALTSSHISEKGSFKTFSAVFSDPALSETEYVNAVTKYTNTKNYSFSPNNELFWKSINNLIWHNDEPIQSPSQFIQWTVFEQAKEHGVKVTLDGQGVDELAAGYPGHFAVFLSELIRRRKITSFIKNFKEIINKSGEGREYLDLLSRTIYLLIPNWTIKFLALFPFFRFFIKGNSLMRFVKKPYKSEWLNLSLQQHLRQKSASVSLNKRMRYDFFEVSLPALLRYEDRCSMAFSIEARTPFLDYRLVEEILSQASTEIIVNGLSKANIRDGVKNFIPKKVLRRTDKKGFPSPSESWLKNSSSKIQSLLSKDSFISHYVDCELLRMELLRDDLNIPKEEVWRLVFAEIWLNEFFEKDMNSGKFIKHSRFSS